MTIDEYRKIAVNKRRINGTPGTEHGLQVECLKWFGLAYPKAIIYAIPNGGYRTKTTAKIMKAEGQLSGVPDLHLPMPRHGFASLYIEMKNGKAGRLSDHQKEIIERLRSYGNKVEVCRTLDEFRKAVDEYLI